MNITAIRSDRIYRSMMSAAPEEKENLYRDELMKPFAFKWACVGIPGYIIGSIVPNEQSLALLPVALAHETNHNVRWQFMQWSNQITLADMIVSEGLAETYAASMFGEDKVGRWVMETSPQTLQDVVKPLIREHLGTSDFGTLSSYLYGDAIMALRGGRPIGMPYCGGYACGYALIGHYLRKTGASIYEATITPTGEILRQTEDFWA